MKKIFFFSFILGLTACSHSVSSPTNISTLQSQNPNIQILGMGQTVSNDAKLLGHFEFSITVNNSSFYQTATNLAVVKCKEMGGDLIQIGCPSYARVTTYGFDIYKK